MGSPTMKVPAELSKLLLAEVKTKFKEGMCIARPYSSARYYKFRKYTRYKVVYHSGEIKIFATDSNVDVLIIVFGEFGPYYQHAFEEWEERIPYADGTYKSSSAYETAIKKFLAEVPRESITSID